MIVKDNTVSVVKPKFTVLTFEETQHVTSFRIRNTERVARVPHGYGFWACWR